MPTVSSRNIDEIKKHVSRTSKYEVLFDGNTYELVAGDELWGEGKTSNQIKSGIRQAAHHKGYRVAVKSSVIDGQEVIFVQRKDVEPAAKAPKAKAKKKTK